MTPLERATIERLAAAKATRDEMVNMILADSDAVCEACEADPRTAEDLTEWFMETVLASGTVARVRCPKCW